MNAVEGPSDRNRLNIAEDGGFWFFAYGSLMWDPPFPIVEATSARLFGWHRAFCVSSENYRGTPARPGLSLGLDAGGSCTGLALKIAATDRETAIREIEARELNHDPIYICRPVTLHLGSETVGGYTLVVNRDERIYAGKIDFDETAQRIAVSEGRRGPNIDYLSNTVAHLDEMGIPEGRLHALLRRAAALRPSL